jgi:tetratricopeptide (TPR) repeat protein
LVLAYSHYKLNQYKDVVPLLQQFPQDHQNYLLVILLLGDSFRGLKEYDMAIDVFKRGPLRKTNLDRYLLQLHYLLALAYKDKGAKADAIREFGRVYAFDVDYKDVTKELEELKPKNIDMKKESDGVGAII